MCRLLRGILIVFVLQALSVRAQAAPILAEHQNISVSIDDESLIVTIATKDGSPFSAEYFDLDSPRRLIVDIRAQISQRNKLQRIKSKLFSAIRFGAHTDRTRVVFDLIGNDLPSFDVTQEGAQLRFQLNRSETAAIMPTPRAVTSSAAIVDASAQPTAKVAPEVANLTPEPQSGVATIQPSASAEATEQPTDSPTVEPTEALATDTPEPPATLAPEVSLLPTATAAVTASATHTSEATSTVATQPSATLTPAPSPTPAAIVTADANAPSVVNAIIFEREGTLQSPIIRIKLNRRSEYRMSRLDDKFYKISLPAVHLERPAIGLPQFPPQDFEGFSLVAAKDEARGIEIKVGVERNSRVSVVPADNDILVRIAR